MLGKTQELPKLFQIVWDRKFFDGSQILYVSTDQKVNMEELFVTQGINITSSGCSSVYR